VGWDPSSDSSGVNSKRGSNEPKAERRFAPDRRQASGILARQFCMKNRRGSRWRGSSDRRYWQESRSISLCADQPRLPLSSATSQSSPACVLATHARSNQPRPGESLLERKSNNARRVRRRPTVASCRSLTVFRRVRRVRMSIRENQPRARTYRLPQTPSHVTITRWCHRMDVRLAHHCASDGQRGEVPSSDDAWPMWHQPRIARSCAAHRDASSRSRPQNR
jgi:hypothetical protein